MKVVLTGGPALRRVYTEETVEKISRIAGEKALFADTVPPDAEALFSTWGMPAFSSDFIEKNLTCLKYVFYGAGSVRGFARPFLENGVRVFSAWQANGVPVAEFTAAQTVLCAKRYFDVFTKAGGTPKGIQGIKAGIIGLGAIGSLVCRILRAKGICVYAYDRFLPDKYFEDIGVRRASLEELFSECDVITNHLADNAETRGMLGRDLIMRMKPDAYFINTGRGAQVDQDALLDALKESPERTALLDVTYPEPLPEGHGLLTCRNAIISPHIAGSLGSEVSEMGRFMCDEFERVVSGLPPLYEVTAEMLEIMA